MLTRKVLNANINVLFAWTIATIGTIARRVNQRI
jgi:hypothetical protein